MGLGFLDFNAGDVPTAAQFDGYLMRQTVMTFATATARDTELSGVLDEGMVTYQEDSDTITYYNGSAWRVISQPRTTFTPTGSGVLTVGNGAFNTDYSRAGETVTWGGFFTFGTTSAISATGVVGLSLPVPAFNTTTPRSGEAAFLDSTSGFWYGARCVIQNAGMAVWRHAEGAVNTVDANTPQTWSPGDEIHWTIDYIPA